VWTSYAGRIRYSADYSRILLAKKGFSHYNFIVCGDGVPLTTAPNGLMTPARSTGFGRISNKQAKSKNSFQNHVKEFFMEHKRDIQITENHKRGINSALCLLDEMLCEFEQYARGRESHSVFYQEQNMLSAKQKNQLLREIEVMRVLLREVKDTLGLKGKVESVPRKISSHCSSFWEVLVETAGKYLKRYGDVSPELFEFLDPRMEQLIEHLQCLSELTRAPSAGGKPPCSHDDEYT